MDPITTKVGGKILEVLGGNFVEKTLEAIDRFTYDKEERAASQARFFDIIENTHLRALEVEAADRADAREREEKLKDSFGVKVMNYSAILAIVGFFAILGILMTVPIPDTNKDVFTILVGALEGVFIAIFMFWFGSSRGSKEKSETVKRLTELIQNSGKTNPASFPTNVYTNTDGVTVVPSPSSKALRQQKRAQRKVDRQKRKEERNQIIKPESNGDIEEGEVLN